MEVMQFKAEHFDYLLENGITDAKLKPWLKKEHGISLEAGNETYTILDDDKKPVVIGGIRQYWFNRGEAWLIIGNTKRKDFIKIHKIVQKFLDLSPIKRIEMVVDYNYLEGHRWAHTLGFKKEAECLKCYRSDGGDVSLYAMVKNES